MAILREVTPLVEPMSLDEAFLDVGGARRLHGTGEEIAVELRRRIRAETGLVASVGVATTKMMAKLASDLAKPDGLLVVDAGHRARRAPPARVSRLWGVGPATRRRLERLGVTHGRRARRECRRTRSSRALGRARTAATCTTLAWNRDDRARSTRTAS